MSHEPSYRTLRELARHGLLEDYLVMVRSLLGQSSTRLAGCQRCIDVLYMNILPQKFVLLTLAELHFACQRWEVYDEDAVEHGEFSIRKSKDSRNVGTSNFEDLLAVLNCIITKCLSETTNINQEEEPSMCFLELLPTLFKSLASNDPDSSANVVKDAIKSLLIESKLSSSCLISLTSTLQECDLTDDQSMALQFRVLDLLEHDMIDDSSFPGLVKNIIGLSCSCVSKSKSFKKNDDTMSTLQCNWFFLLRSLLQKTLPSALPNVHFIVESSFLHFPELTRTLLIYFQSGRAFRSHTLSPRTDDMKGNIYTITLDEHDLSLLVIVAGMESFSGESFRALHDMCDPVLRASFPNMCDLWSDMLKLKGIDNHRNVILHMGAGWLEMKDPLFSAMGDSILASLFCEIAASRKSLLDHILSCVGEDPNVQIKHMYLQLLGKIVQKSPLDVSEHVDVIQNFMPHLTLLPFELALGLLSTTLPVVSVCTSYCDFLVVFLKKLLITRHVSEKSIAIKGICSLLRFTAHEQNSLILSLRPAFSFVLPLRELLYTELQGCLLENRCISSSSSSSTSTVGCILSPSALLSLAEIVAERWERYMVSSGDDLTLFLRKCFDEQQQNGDDSSVDDSPDVIVRQRDRFGSLLTLSMTLLSRIKTANLQTEYPSYIVKCVLGVLKIVCFPEQLLRETELIPTDVNEDNKLTGFYRVHLFFPIIQRLANMFISNPSIITDRGILYENLFHGSRIDNLGLQLFEVSSFFSLMTETSRFVTEEAKCGIHMVKPLPFHQFCNRDTLLIVLSKLCEIDQHGINGVSPHAACLAARTLKDMLEMQKKESDALFTVYNGSSRNISLDMTNIQAISKVVLSAYMATSSLVHTSVENQGNLPSNQLQHLVRTVRDAEKSKDEKQVSSTKEDDKEEPPVDGHWVRVESGELEWQVIEPKALEVIEAEKRKKVQAEKAREREAKRLRKKASWLAPELEREFTQLQCFRDEIFELRAILLEILCSIASIAEKHAGSGLCFLFHAHSISLSSLVDHVRTLFSEDDMKTIVGTSNSFTASECECWQAFLLLQFYGEMKIGIPKNLVCSYLLVFQKLLSDMAQSCRSTSWLSVSHLMPMILRRVLATYQITQPTIISTILTLVFAAAKHEGEWQSACRASALLRDCLEKVDEVTHAKMLDDIVDISRHETPTENRRSSRMIAKSQAKMNTLVTKKNVTNNRDMSLDDILDGRKATTRKRSLVQITNTLSVHMAPIPEVRNAQKMKVCWTEGTRESVWTVCFAFYEELLVSRRQYLDKVQKGEVLTNGSELIDKIAELFHSTCQVLHVIANDLFFLMNPTDFDEMEWPSVDVEKKFLALTTKFLALTVSLVKTSRNLISTIEKIILLSMEDLNKSVNEEGKSMEKCQYVLSYISVFASNVMGLLAGWLNGNLQQFGTKKLRSLVFEIEVFEKDTKSFLSISDQYQKLVRKRRKLNNETKVELNDDIEIKERENSLLQMFRQTVTEVKNTLESDIPKMLSESAKPMRVTISAGNARIRSRNPYIDSLLLKEESKHSRDTYADLEEFIVS